jgi:trans-2,3-dihydro-3-hydroxyanthranilate isomerase
MSPACHDWRVEITWTTVFADGANGGNPCPIVSDADGLSTEQLQAMAAEFGVETVFVLAPHAEGDVRLRYFVPRHEMEMCVHATIAATVDLGDRLPRSTRVETALGTIRVTRDADSAVVDQFPPVYGPVVDPASVIQALGIDATVLAGPIRSVSTARPKLMIPLRDEPSLDALAPDFERLWTACDDLDVTGFYPFTVAARDADVAARQFPKRSGYDEDPATGVAACGLGAYLALDAPDGWHRWTIAQGRAMGRPSLITAEALVVDGRVTATRVGGAMRRISPPAA